ncbi:MAG: GNAT family N-acetyltransferase, partial [Solirubrobacteraceae bacterium]
DRDAAHRLARAISALWLPLEIPRLPADAPILAAFRSACRRSAAVIARPAPAAPAIDLDPTWEEPESKLTSRRRADLRRARRRAELIGGVQVEVTAPTPAGFDDAFRRAVAVEAAGWKGRSGTALATDARAVGIFRSYLAAAATNGTLRVVWLRIGGRPAAMQLAVQSAGRFRLLKVGHDEQFNRCSPGHLLLLGSIRYAALAGLASYELLGHPEPWTRVWTEHERPCVDLRVFPASASGIGALTADTAAYLGTRVRAIRGRQAARGA